MPTKEETIYDRMNAMLLEKIKMKDAEINFLLESLKNQDARIKKYELLAVVAYMASAFTIFIILERIFDFYLRTL